MPRARPRGAVQVWAPRAVAVQQLGDEAIKTIAQEIGIQIRKNITIMWTEKKGVPVNMRATLVRILRMHGYQPD